MPKASPSLVLVAFLALSLASLATPANGADRNEVRQALLRAARNPKVQVAAKTFLRLMNTRWGRWLNYGANAGPITIMLPANFAFIRYRWQKLTAEQTISLFNYNIVKGNRNFKDLFNLPAGKQLFTAYKNRPLRRAYSPKNVMLKIGTKQQGRRSPCEVFSTVIIPNVYLGKTLSIHGVNCFLTPPDVRGGPYWYLRRV